MLLNKIFVVYNLGAMTLLQPRFGIYRALLAHGSAEASKHLFIWWLVRRTAIWTNFRATLISSVLLWGTVTTIFYSIENALALPGILQLHFGVLIFGAGVLIYVRTPAIAATDRQTQALVFHGAEARILQLASLVNPDTQCSSVA
jgi:hypothetical protein